MVASRMPWASERPSHAIQIEERHHNGVEQVSPFGEGVVSAVRTFDGAIGDLAMSRSGAESQHLAASFRRPEDARGTNLSSSSHRLESIPLETLPAAVDAPWVFPTERSPASLASLDLMGGELAVQTAVAKIEFLHFLEEMAVLESVLGPNEFPQGPVDQQQAIDIRFQLTNPDGCIRCPVSGAGRVGGGLGHRRLLRPPQHLKHGSSLGCYRSRRTA